MTALQYAMAECANAVRGRCEGARIGDGLRTGVAIRRVRCLLAAGERCPYFEESVLPLAGYATDPRKAKAAQSAAHEYRTRHMGGGSDRKRGTECP